MRSCLGWDAETQEGKVYSISNPRPIPVAVDRAERHSLQKAQSRELSFLGPIRAWNLNNFLFLGKTDEWPGFHGYLMRPVLRKKGGC